MNRNRTFIRNGALSLVIGLLFAGASVAEEYSVADPTGRFVQVQEGLLDSTTGLVWGFGWQETEAFLRGFDGFAQNRDWTYTQTMSIAGPDEGFTTYPAFSNAFFGRQDTDWRVPTIDELAAAYNAGLTDYLDASPEPGFQHLGFLLHPDYSDGDYWIAMTVFSSNGAKVGGRQGGWAIDLATGATFKTIGHLINGIAVRGAPPPGGGKGGGKK